MGHPVYIRIEIALTSLSDNSDINPEKAVAISSTGGSEIYE